MGSSKKHKKHKSEKREKYEEYSNQMDPSQWQRGLKLILKVGSNSTPEYGGGDTTLIGPPTAAEAMMSTAPSSPVCQDEKQQTRMEEHHHSEKHKKSKKKKKKKDREKKHKHHKEKRHRNERREQRKKDGCGNGLQADNITAELACNDEHLNKYKYLDVQMVQQNTQPTNHSTISSPQRSPRNIRVPPSTMDCDSSQDGFSFMEEVDSQPLPGNVLLYAGVTTENAPSSRPVSKPIVPRKIDDLLDSPVSSSTQSPSAGPGILGPISPSKQLPEVSHMLYCCYVKNTSRKF